MVSERNSTIQGLMATAGQETEGLAENTVSQETLEQLNDRVLAFETALAFAKVKLNPTRPRTGIINEAITLGTSYVLTSFLPAFNYDSLISGPSSLFIQL